MKKNRIFHLCTLLLGLGLLMVNLSCKDDPDAPIAEFSFEQSTTNILEFVFANESVNAESYSWDFGDEATSTDASPTHVYADYGTYTVTLTATGEGGTTEVSYDIEIIDPGIIIDGIFDDWSDISAIASYPDGEGRTLLELKVTNNDAFIFFQIKGTSNLGEIIQIFIDADNDSTSGWDYWNFFESPGIDYMMEAVLVPFGTTTESADLFAATGPDSNWPWVSIVSNVIQTKSSYVVDGNSKIVEFSMLKDLFTTPALSGTIRIVIGNSDNTWANVGHLPPSATDPLTAPATYVMQ